MANSHLHGLILAGGRGTRFWPRSRTHTPKQLLSFLGAQSLIQETAERLEPMIPRENLWVLTNRHLEQEIRRQLPGVPRRQIFAEPAQRNTAPCLGLAAQVIYERDPEAILGVFPADHHIGNPARFRQWMKDRGYREKPLYLSEYGILMPPDYGFEAPRVNAYMNKTFDYLTTATSATLGYPADGNRLVQKWSWYSVTDQTYNGWLFDSGNGQMTAVGRNYAAHTAAVAVEHDLAPWRLVTDPASPHYAGQPLTIQLKVDVSNAGNLAAKIGPAVVRFYNGNPAQGGQQIGADQTVQLAGCGDSAVAAVNWANVGPGTHAIYVRVDPGNAITETNETNNTQSFSVQVAP